MEIDITNFARNADPCEFSASKFELGNDAGRITWGNALRQAEVEPMLTTEEQLDACRAWLRSLGGWSEDEIAAFSSDQCNALLIQFISGDLRELQKLCPDDDDDFGIDWMEAESLAEQGTIGGRIDKGDNERVYFYMGD